MYLDLSFENVSSKRNPVCAALFQARGDSICDDDHVMLADGMADTNTDARKIDMLDSRKGGLDKAWSILYLPHLRIKP
ncbi:hypothetical protein CHS0354_034103 [Potamilus streckersoni]|uniref:Uncharacterized protein n=1 Tax=Potamilus streckersoni TaxID=2493646 RepID=A0AAE0WCB7_9BIVA|nr:hypothetical protein CHS0354_034103 [Potamilus streckersoni]